MCQIHEDWWSQYCVGLMEEFPWLSPQERRSVLARHKLVDRFCQGVYIGPGSNKTLLQCLVVRIELVKISDLEIWVDGWLIVVPVL